MSFSNEKYESAETKLVGGVTMYRIRSKVRIKSGYRIHAEPGSLGGWVQGEKNLDISGNSWVHDNAIVCSNAVVSGNAQIYGDARIFGNAQIYGDAKVSDGSFVFGDAKVFGEAVVFGRSSIHGSARVSSGVLQTSTSDGRVIVAVQSPEGPRVIDGLNYLSFDEMKALLSDGAIYEGSYDELMVVIEFLERMCEVRGFFDPVI